MKNFFKIILLTFIFNQIIYTQEIALSFDDAPRNDGFYYSGVERTKILIEKLKSLNIPQAVFFCTTSNIDSIGEERLEMYSAAGHLIANHSHSHKSLNSTDPEEYINDINKADKILSGFSTFVKWYRFPFLHEGTAIESRDFVRTKLKEMGYINGYVTIDNYDWYMEALLQKAMKEKKEIDFEKLKIAYLGLLWDCIKFYDNIAVKTLGRSPKHVLLLHENDIAALFIDDLVNHIRKNGGEIISPEDAYKDSIAFYSPNVLLNNQGRVAAIAKENGYNESLCHPSEDEKYLDNIFKENGIIK